MNTKRLSRRSALGLIGGGALLTLSGSGAFSSSSAGRGVSIQAADDSAAFLGLEGLGSDGDATFTNRTNDTITIDLEILEILEQPDGADGDPEDVTIDVGDDGDEETGSAEFELDSGDDEVVILGGPAERVLASIDGEFTRDGDRTGAISMEREMDVSQADQVQLTPNVESTGASGRFEFELQNTGDIDVEFAFLAIDDTTADSDEVDDGLYDETDDIRVVEGPIPVVGGEPEPEDFREFDPQVVLAAGEDGDGDARVFEFDRFLSTGQGGRPHADMRGESVTITIEFADGSSAQVEMEDE